MVHFIIIGKTIRKHARYLALSFIFTSLYVFFSLQKKNQFIDVRINADATVSIKNANYVAGFKKCVNNGVKLYSLLPERFFVEIKICIRNHFAFDELEMDEFYNDINGERKIFFPLRVFHNPCKWLTIGIGGTNDAEKEFKKQYPDCEIYGVEPNNPGKFGEIGNVIPFGVGLKDEEMELVIDLNKTWTKKKISVLSLPSLLDQYLFSRFVHYLTIDIEGYEYEILKEIIAQQKSMTFCQIDAELHSPKMETIHPAVKNLNVVQFISEFINSTSPFIPIFTEPYAHYPHQKITFINIVDPLCEQAFQFSQYFSANKK